MTLEFITPGRMRVPEALLFPRLSLRMLRIPTTVAVLRRADGTVVLCDAGFSRAEMDDMAFELGLAESLIYRVEGGPTQSAVAQLAAMGIEPSAVSAIVATHLHLDHIGAYVDFPNAEIITTADELRDGLERGRMGGYYHLDAIRRSGRARPVTLRSGERWGFPGHLDLFGDGEVVLLDARGHTAGSLAVLLTCGESRRQAFMIGDAVDNAWEYRQRRACLLERAVAFRADWMRATWDRVARFEEQNPHIPVVPAHSDHAFCGLHG